MNPTPTPDLHLSLTFTLRASGTTAKHAEEALDRLAHVIYGMNAQEGVIRPQRAPNTPLAFALSAPINAPDGGAIGALQLLQMVILHLGTALSRHYGEPIAYQGEVVTGATMRGGFVDHPVNLGPVDGHRYTFVDSVVQREDGSVAFPEIVEGSLNKMSTVVQDVVTAETDALELAGDGQTPGTARPRLRR